MSNYMELLKEADYTDVMSTKVFDYYRQCYLQNARYEHIVNSDRVPPIQRDNQFIGVSNRTLGLQIPERNSAQGGKIRGTLLQVGLLKASGHELFRGCIVLPTKNSTGQFVSAVGYRYGTRIRHWQPSVIYWKRPDDFAYASNTIRSIREVLHGKA